MKRNCLWMLGVAAVLAACSNHEVVEEAAQSEIPFDGKVTLTAEPDISVIQSRAVVETWKNTPIRVWGLSNDQTGWTDASGNLFVPAEYVNGVVADGTGAVKLGSGVDVYFYPLQSDANFSFYGCSPHPDYNSPATDGTVRVQYTVTGNKDILWGEAVAEDIQGTDGKTYKGYNARYFRKASSPIVPKLQFKHLLSQLQFEVVGGDKSATSGDVQAVQVKNITVLAQNNAYLNVAGARKGTLDPYGESTEIPAYFGDEPYNKKLDVNPGQKTQAGTAMVLPSTTGKYTLNVTLAAMVGGKEKLHTTPIEITYKENGQVTPFQAGKAYKVSLTVYGLRIVNIEAGLNNWEQAGEIIDQEVN